MSKFQENEHTPGCHRKSYPTHNGWKTLPGSKGWIQARYDIKCIMGFYIALCTVQTTQGQVTIVFQWRISSRRGRQLPGGGRQHTNLPNFPKNCMKLKEFGPPGGRSPCSPLRSATVFYCVHPGPSPCPILCPVQCVGHKPSMLQSILWVYLCLISRFF